MQKICHQVLADMCRHDVVRMHVLCATTHAQRICVKLDSGVASEPCRWQSKSVTTSAAIKAAQLEGV